MEYGEGGTGRGANARDTQISQEKLTVRCVRPRMPKAWVTIACLSNREYYILETQRDGTLVCRVALFHDHERFVATFDDRSDDARR